LGVTDITDPRQNIDAGARYLRQQLDQFKTVPLALSAYNSGPGGTESSGRVQPYAETLNYVRRIMAHAPPSASVTSSGQVAQPVELQSPKLVDAGSNPARPAFPPAVLQALNQGNALLGLPKLRLDLLPPASPTPPVAQSRRTSTPAPAPATVDATQGAVTWAHESDPSKAPREPVKQFVGTIASVYGKPLATWPSTGHNQFVAGTKGKVESAHWTGWAVDAPAAGDALTKLGYSALLAAGMNPRQAMSSAKKGGAFNVNGYNILFKTKIGGNHWDHLHVGLRPEHPARRA
jgi:hypothetical protein